MGRKKSKQPRRHWPKYATGAVCHDRDVLWIVQHGQCFYCCRRLTPQTMTTDHIIPKSKGGPSNFFNYVGACGECNTKKADQEIDPDWVRRRLEFFCGGGSG